MEQTTLVHRTYPSLCDFHIYHAGSSTNNLPGQSGATLKEHKPSHRHESKQTPRKAQGALKRCSVPFSFVNTDVSLSRHKPFKRIQNQAPQNAVTHDEHKWPNDNQLL